MRRLAWILTVATLNWPTIGWTHHPICLQSPLPQWVPFSFPPLLQVPQSSHLHWCPLILIPPILIPLIWSPQWRWLQCRMCRCWVQSKHCMKMFKWCECLRTQKSPCWRLLSFLSSYILLNTDLTNSVKSCAFTRWYSMISYRKSVIILFFKTGQTIDKCLFQSNLRFFSIMWDTMEMLAHPTMLHSGQALVLEQWWTVLTVSWHHYWTNMTDSYISLTSIQRICNKHEDVWSLRHAVRGGTECLWLMELQSICMQDQGCLAMDSTTGSLIFHWIVR